MSSPMDASTLRTRGRCGWKMSARVRAFKRPRSIPRPRSVRSRYLRAAWPSFAGGNSPKYSRSDGWVSRFASEGPDPRSILDGPLNVGSARARPLLAAARADTVHISRLARLNRAQRDPYERANRPDSYFVIDGLWDLQKLGFT